MSEERSTQQTTTASQMGERPGRTGAAPRREQRSGQRGRRPQGGRRPYRRGRFQRRRRVCAFCLDKTKEIDYKDISTLRRFLTEAGAAPQEELE